MPHADDGPADERCSECGRLDPVNCPCPPTFTFIVHVRATVAYRVTADDEDDARNFATYDLAGLTPVDTVDGPDVVHIQREDPR